LEQAYEQVGKGGYADNFDNFDELRRKDVRVSVRTAAIRNIVGSKLKRRSSWVSPVTLIG
jgi:hypothetical protein